MARPTDNIPRPTAASLEHAKFTLLGRLKRCIEEINMGHTPGEIAGLVDDLKALDGIKAAETKDKAAA